MEILPYLTTAKRGYTCKGDLCEVIQCILYKLKTGCQWHLIPTMAIFTEVVLHYKTIFGKFRQWCKDGSWQKSWESLLERNRDKIDLSSADLDGSHTVARRGGEEVGGAAHKAAQTTNSIFITDRQGIPIAMSDPKSGRHHDVHEIENSLDQIFGMMRNAGIPTDGLFLNADLTATISEESARVWESLPMWTSTTIPKMMRNTFWTPNFSPSDIVSNERMHGWIPFDPFSTVSTKLLPVGKGGICWHSM